MPIRIHDFSTSSPVDDATSVWRRILAFLDWIGSLDDRRPSRILVRVRRRAVLAFGTKGRVSRGGLEWR
jgi:hypothetical protein